MEVFVEIEGKRAEIIMFETREEVESEMIKRYNKRVKEMDSIDWDRTGFDRENLYGRVRGSHRDFEWMVGSMRKAG